MSSSAVGIAAEQVAADFLTSRGYQILDRNWSRKWGELDIVALKNGVAIFCEVKAAKQKQEGFDPEIRADRSKLQKVARTARTWMAYRKYPPEQEWQIDVISVTFNEIARTADIKHFRNVEI